MPETIFGQIIVGPPGSGKSTYCKCIADNLRQLGRNPKIINLDPANDNLLYKPSINITELVTVDMIMKELNLGPNGAMIRCIEELKHNFGWLFDHIVKIIGESEEQFAKAHKDHGEESKQLDKVKYRPYLLIDCPGQSELYIHNVAMKEIIKNLTARNNYFDLRLVCLNLCDSYHASDISKYIGLCMNSLTTMIHLELPHLNILSKVDIIEKHGKTRFNLDFYCDAANLEYLLETDVESPFFAKYRKLTQSIMGVISDYSLVTFYPLNISKPEDIYKILQMADKANGYYCDDLDLSILQMNPRLMEMASGKRGGTINDATSGQI